jgi:hypothetical protein
MLLLWWTGCKTPGGEMIIARVGDRVLTLEQIKQELPSGIEDSLKNQAADEYIRRWVDEELILTEAYNRRIDEENWVARTMEKYRRTILIARMLDQEVMADSLVGDSDVEKYYLDHESEFKRTEDEVLVSYFVTSEELVAKRARTQWVRGASFTEVLNNEGSLWGDDSVTVTKGELGSLEDRVFRLGEGVVTQVERAGENWVVFRVIQHYQAGTVRDLSEVAREIRARLLAMRNKEARDSFLERLHAKYQVEVDEEALKRDLSPSPGGKK